MRKESYEQCGGKQKDLGHKSISSKTNIVILQEDWSSGLLVFRRELSFVQVFFEDACSPD